MKKIILITGLLVLANILFCQTNNDNYFDFFGKKYYLSDTITNNGPYFKNCYFPRKETFEYTLCGKHLLNEKHEMIMYNKENQDDIIVKTFFSFSDRKKFDNVVDSLLITDLNKDMDFNIVIDKKKYKILGYKILADGINYEIEYKNTSDRIYVNNRNVLTDNELNYATQIFMRTIKDTKNCSKFMLKDIRFYDTDKGIMYYLDLEILLKQ